MLVISERSSIIQNKHTHRAWHFLQFVKQGTVSHASERERASGKQFIKQGKSFTFQ